MIQCFDTLRAVGSAGLPEGLPGVHSIWSGSMYEFEQPLKLGDKVRSKSYLKEVRDADSSFAGGRTVFQTYEAVYFNQKDEKLGVRQDTWIRNERHTTKKTGKYGQTELSTWTLDQIHDLWKSYEEEERTVDRKWDSVKVGDELKPILKGPLTPTAEIAFESFFGVYLVGNKVAANLYKRHPKLMIPNEQGVPEPPQRVHWDNQFTKNLLSARRLRPRSERCAWLSQIATNWMGDAGFFRKIEAQYRKFNYMGDLTWIKGKVVEKAREKDLKIARCEVWCENHRGEQTAKARVEIVLP
jgi:acyl-CoA thioesterase FadM